MNATYPYLMIYGWNRPEILLTNIMFFWQKNSVWRKLDFERNHSEEYKKMMEERERLFNEDMERLRKLAEKMES